MQEWQSFIWPQRYSELLALVAGSRDAEETPGDLSLITEESYTTCAEIMSFLLRESEAHSQHEEAHHDTAVGNQSEQPPTHPVHKVQPWESD